MYRKLNSRTGTLLHLYVTKINSILAGLVYNRIKEKPYPIPSLLTLFRKKIAWNGKLSYIDTGRRIKSTRCINVLLWRMSNSFFSSHVQPLLSKVFSSVIRNETNLSTRTITKHRVKNTVKIKNHSTVYAHTLFLFSRIFRSLFREIDP